MIATAASFVPTHSHHLISRSVAPRRTQGTRRGIYFCICTLLPSPDFTFCPGCHLPPRARRRGEAVEHARARHKAEHGHCEEDEDLAASTPSPNAVTEVDAPAPGQQSDHDGDLTLAQRRPRRQAARQLSLAVADELRLAQLGQLWTRQCAFGRLHSFRAVCDDNVDIKRWAGVRVA